MKGRPSALRFENLIEANKLEAERKAKLAAMTIPPSGIEPEPLPDYTIWMRGQRAAAP